MRDTILLTLTLLAILVAMSPILLGVGWVVWNGWVRPRFIPRSEIDRLADDIMARYPDDPERAALREEEHYWFQSEEFEQGKWRRVRAEIRRRLRQQAAKPV